MFVGEILYGTIFWPIDEPYFSLQFVFKTIKVINGKNN